MIFRPNNSGNAGNSRPPQKKSFRLPSATPDRDLEMGRSTRRRKRPRNGPTMPGCDQPGCSGGSVGTSSYTFRSVPSSGWTNTCTCQRTVENIEISCGAAAVNSIIGKKIFDDEILATVHDFLGESEYNVKGASAKGLLGVLGMFRFGQQLRRRSARHPEYPGFTDALDPTLDQCMLLNNGKVAPHKCVLHWLNN